ncbi:3-(3-hydroxyphenyl)propionate hydroxylase [Nocardia sp. SYP-A9097]|uniref:FAD-dependent monooxygenase n=1 Tax=Nocardia sp. SYP-A9097 TaxID=2663237 RepID=UPI00129A606F|nr:FAD-dependent monooxygenase [Nocardia sp. SYP-A9097]MRH87505.1 3-(3-hydroxyphenyl)propionate hydroxylase [Nocardia sp. SYP-A9097]
MFPQVLIAGAGPTGLTLAIDLARRGVAVRIVDHADAFFDGSRGDGIQPRTLEVFDDLGVLDAVLAAGIPQPLMRIHLGGELVAERRMTPPREATPDVPHPNPWVLGQSDTEGLLRDRLAEFGVEVELGTGVAEFVADEDGVTVTLAHGDATETVRVAYLVGADGGRSTVRKVLGIAFEGTTDESIRMLLGDVRADALDHEFGYWFANAENPMAGIAMSPLPGGRKFQFMAPLDQDTGTDLAALQRLLEERTGRTDIVLSEASWSTVWRPNIRLAERFRVGRVFLAGDAAHVHPPTGGQGLNTGVQDAYNLGWKLEAALRNPRAGSEALLDSYEAERRSVAARVLGLSSALLDKTVNGDADAMDREGTQQLDISYRDVVAGNDSGDPGTRELIAGDRAPDAPLVDAAGRRLTLFEAFRGPQATLLMFGGEPVSPGEMDMLAGTQILSVVRPGTDCTGVELVDFAGHAYRAYGVGDGARVLVRPDGYVGFLTR